MLAAALASPAAAIGAGCVQGISGGTWHSAIVRADGTVAAVGGGELAQIGNGLSEDVVELQIVSGLAGVIAADAGGFHTLALLGDGGVQSWGLNNAGQLGTGDRVSSSVPLVVAGLSDVVAVAAGGFHSLALRRDGSVMAWGRNASAQLASGNTNPPSNVPVPVMGLPDFTVPMSGITAIAAGFIHSLAVGPGGVVYAWGSNARGQLNGARDGWRLVEVPGLTGMVAVDGGVGHSLALGGDGRVWAWGSNLSGQLGDGSSIDPLIPIVVPGLAGATAIAAGGYHSLALLADGTVRAWGYNKYGQIGDGALVNALSPAVVTGLVNIEAIAAGRFHSLAIDRDGIVWVWGMNEYGQMGTGDLTSSPVAIRTLAPCRTCSIGAAAARPKPVRPGTTVTLDASASVATGCPGGLEYQWEVGATIVRPFSPDPRFSPSLGSRTSYRVRVRCIADPSCQATADVIASVLPAPACEIIAIASAWHHGLALGSNGRVWAWGYNVSGQCGLGSSSPAVSLPTLVPDLVDVVAVAARGYTSYALDVDGRLWAWGNGSQYGLLGDGNTEFNQSLVPRLVPEVRQAASVSAGGTHVLMLKPDGTVWGFGSDQYNQLGAGTWDGTPSTPMVPTVELERVIAIAAGADHSYGTSAHSLMLRDDGAVWAMGSSFWGELGRGTFERGWVSGPDLAAPNLAPPTAAIAAGFRHSFALDAAGLVRTWGYNSHGQLGDGTTVHSPTPALISLPLTRAVAAFHLNSMALARDGTVWTWGRNDVGQLGNGTTADSNRPVMVSGLTSIEAIAAGNPMLALKSDGSLWSWGYNGSGELGIGTLGGMSTTPVEVVASWNLPAPDVVFNSLRAIRSGGDAVLTWGTTGLLQRFNLHRTDVKSDLATIWLSTPLADAITGLTFTDPAPTPAPGTPWHYQVFGGDCAGLSEPRALRYSASRGTIAFARRRDAAAARSSPTSVWRSARRRWPQGFLGSRSTIEVAAAKAPS